jgi:hypothetical protein
VIDQMVRLPVLPNGDTIPYAHGVHLATYRGLRTITRGGNSNGTRTEIIRFPEQRFTVTTLCNGSHLPPGTLGERVADHYLSELLQPASEPAPPPPPVAIAATELTRYTGTYRSKSDSWNVSRFELRDGRIAELLGDTAQTFTFIGSGSFSGDGSPGFHVTFAQDSENDPMRAFFSFEGEPDEPLYRVTDAALWRPVQSELAEYAGSYFSSDIDAAWQFESSDGQLVLRRAAAPDVPLTPNERDRFVGGIGDWTDLLELRLQFQRDAAGRVAHLSVSTPPGEGAVQHLRFDRQRSGLPR